MEHWIAQLRGQAQQMAQGDYEPGSGKFAGAPADIAGLGKDLDALAQAMAERDAACLSLAREVHHRVKGNLQIVTSLVEMQANNACNPAEREGLGQARARLGGLALIYRIFYEGEDQCEHGSIDIAELVMELCSQFRVWHRHRRNITLSCEVIPCALRLDLALPLALFAVEALICAYSRAFPYARCGQIALDFGIASNGWRVLSICDNGIGPDNRCLPAAMSHQLMQGFASQLGGQFEMTGEADNVAIAKLKFPTAL